MPKRKYAEYKAADPYFSLIRQALGDLVDGEHFFDIVTDDTVYEVLYGSRLASRHSRANGSNDRVQGLCP
jgi:hypothetical protein